MRSSIQGTHSFLAPGIGPSPQGVQVPLVAGREDQRAGEGSAEGRKGGGWNGHLCL